MPQQQQQAEREPPFWTWFIENPPPTWTAAQKIGIWIRIRAGLSDWRGSVFAWMARNTGDATSYFGLPPRAWSNSARGSRSNDYS